LRSAQSFIPGRMESGRFRRGKKKKEGKGLSAFPFLYRGHPNVGHCSERRKQSSKPRRRGEKTSSNSFHALTHENSWAITTTILAGRTGRRKGKIKRGGKKKAAPSRSKLAWKRKQSCPFMPGKAATRPYGKGRGGFLSSTPKGGGRRTLFIGFPKERTKASLRTSRSHQKIKKKERERNVPVLTREVRKRGSWLD